jgi:hypothetical protein
MDPYQDMLEHLSFIWAPNSLSDGCWRLTDSKISSFLKMSLRCLDMHLLSSLEIPHMTHQNNLVKNVKDTLRDTKMHHVALGKENSSHSSQPLSLCLPSVCTLCFSACVYCVSACVCLMSDCPTSVSWMLSLTNSYTLYSQNSTANITWEMYMG